MALVFVDAFMTTVNVSAGAGPLTQKVLAWCWRGLLRLHQQDARSTPLAAGGTMLLTATVVVWIVLLWFGWGLLFFGAHTVVDSTTLRPAGVADVGPEPGFREAVHENESRRRRLHQLVVSDGWSWAVPVHD